MQNNTNKPIILVVDDEPTNINILARLLQTEYRILVATISSKAIEIASKSMPDLILLDVMMPDMDGYEVCRKLKANIITRGIPVIFVTAMGEEHYEATGFEVGGVDYITKPIKPFILKARVKTHIELKIKMEEILKLRGLLPICCVCKKIRDDSGYWNQIESYISLHSEIVFSHSYCPECEKKAMEDFQ
ncbi:MAG: response regulator [Proteobacteria bacterium]|nr:response regulator [Pseudomonadota bacterium]